MVALARRLGATPAQLVLLVACLALGAYAAFFFLDDPSFLRILVWFAGAAVVHDLVLFPLYSTLDRALAAVGRGRVPLVNHVRVPALGAGLALLMFWPGIVRQGEDTHIAASGLDQAPYLGRWLALTGVLFAASAVLYGLRVVLDRARRPRTRPERAEPERAAPLSERAEPEQARPAPTNERTAERPRSGRTGGGPTSEHHPGPRGRVDADPDRDDHGSSPARSE